MKVNLSMDDIRTKVEEYIKKAGRATGRPVLTAYYVMTADTTPDNERTNIIGGHCVSYQYRGCSGTDFYGR